MTTENISKTIHKLTLDNGDVITLVGTAHISADSVKEVHEVLDSVNPDRVCLELDNSRYKAKAEKSAYDNMDLQKVFKEGKTFLVLANTALASFQKRMGSNLGNKPGEEILSAGEYAKENGIPISLCDREINITFKRAWAMSSFWNKSKLIASLFGAIFEKEEISEEEIEEMKKTDSLQGMMSELANELPAAKKALIDERDRFLATSIFLAEGHNKVAVIGAGHTNGIIQTIKDLEAGKISTDLSDISKSPAPSKFGKIASWAIPALIILYIVFCCFNYGFGQGMKNFLIWVISNGASSMLFAVLALSHPLNWLVAAISAPIAVMSPVIGVGMFTGMAEATLRKPKVKDFENITDDISTFKGWFKNKVLHTFTVFFATTIGSILGTVVTFPLLLKIFNS